MRFTVRALTATVAAAALLTMVAACGDDDDDSGSAATTAAGAATTAGGAATTAAGSEAGGLEGAKSRVEAALVEPTEIGITEPLSKKPDTGKNIYFLQCGVGVCQAIGDEQEKAAKLLGWNFIRVDLGTTPEEIVAGWDTVLAAEPAPDGIITSGVPTVVFQTQLDEARERGIPVVDYASANPADPGIIFDVLPPADNTKRGELMADFIAADSEADAKVLLINVPDFPVLVVQEEAFKKQLGEVCEGCEVEVKNFAATDIGQSIPGAVVSYLQSNPDTNYVVASFDDMGLGVAEAIETAGLGDKVKIVAQSGAVSAVDNIVNDRVQVMTIPQGPGMVGFKVMDVFARHFNGDSLDADSANLLPIWIQTKETITDPKNVWLGPPGFEDQFTELWLVN